MSTTIDTAANADLVQQAERLRLAIKDIQNDISLVEARFREINHSLILVVAALDWLDDERHESNEEGDMSTTAPVAQ